MSIKEISLSAWQTGFVPNTNTGVVLLAVHVAHGHSQSTAMHFSASGLNGLRLVVVATLDWCNGPQLYSQCGGDGVWWLLMIIEMITFRDPVFCLFQAVMWKKRLNLMSLNLLHWLAQACLLRQHFYCCTGGVLAGRPCGRHQWLLWVSAGIEPRPPRCKSVAWAMAAAENTNGNFSIHVTMIFDVLNPKL